MFGVVYGISSWDYFSTSYTSRIPRRLIEMYTVVVTFRRGLLDLALARFEPNQKKTLIFVEFLLENKAKRRI